MVMKFRQVTLNGISNTGGCYERCEICSYYERWQKVMCGL